MTQPRIKYVQKSLEQIFWRPAVEEKTCLKDRSHHTVLKCDQLARHAPTAGKGTDIDQACRRGKFQPRPAPFSTSFRRLVAFVEEPKNRARAKKSGQTYIASICGSKREPRRAKLPRCSYTSAEVDSLLLFLVPCGLYTRSISSLCAVCYPGEESEREEVVERGKDIHSTQGSGCWV